MATTDGVARAPRVCVSYSHDSREHMDRVLALCDRLRHEGVEAELDQYEPVPPEGWPLWTARKVEQADFVLVVCTETYRRRFDGHEEAGKGLGVRWEGAVVAQALYEAGAQNHTFLPVLFSPTDDPHIPLVLRGSTRFLVSDEEGYEQLYRHLTAQPAVLPPDLGARRVLPPRPRRTDSSSSSGQPARRFRWKWGVGALILAIAFLTALIPFSNRETNRTTQPESSAAVPLSILQGEILDAQIGEPLAGVEVRLPKYDLAKTTDVTGKYRFEVSALNVTSIKVRATKKGYRTLNLDLPPGDHLNTHRMWRNP